MKKLFTASGILCVCLQAIPQNTFQSSLLSGLILPLSSGTAFSPHNGAGMHFGNHFNYVLGAGKMRMGIGGYAGQLISFEAGAYKKTAQALAEKHRLPAEQLRYKESAFKSAAFLLGPVINWQGHNISAGLWAKGGYGINEPGQFSATLQDVSATRNVFVQRTGDEKNSMAYSVGGGLHYSISSMVGVQLAANFYSTQTEIINYSYDRERGNNPYTFNAKNRFIQASVGLQISLPGKNNEERGPQRTQARSENRKDRKENDTLYFVPRSISIHDAQVAVSDSRQLQATNSFLTAFLYQAENGPVISQCTGAERPGNPVAGKEVQIKNVLTQKVLNVRTQEDGSFSVKEAQEGLYHALINKDTSAFVIRNRSAHPDYELAREVDECGNQFNRVVYVNGKLYAAVITAREAGSGLATGRRAEGASEQRPQTSFMIAHTDLVLNYTNTIHFGGQQYAEVITAREAGSGLATGRSAFVGDVDGDGLTDKIVEKATSGVKQVMQTQVRMMDTNEEEVEELMVERSPKGFKEGIKTQVRVINPEIDYPGVKTFHIETEGKNNRTLLMPTEWQISSSAPMPNLVYSVQGVNDELPTAIINTSRSNIKGQRLVNVSAENAEESAILINTSRSNIKAQRLAATNNGAEAQKTVINTSRSNIKNQRVGAAQATIQQVNNMQLANGSCVVNALVVIDGIQYNATVIGVLKTRHDTTKNAIGNIR